MRTLIIITSIIALNSFVGAAEIRNGEEERNALKVCLGHLLRRAVPSTVTHFCLLSTLKSSRDKSWTLKRDMSSLPKIPTINGYIEAESMAIVYDSTKKCFSIRGDANAVPVALIIIEHTKQMKHNDVDGLLYQWRVFISMDRQARGKTWVGRAGESDRFDTVDLPGTISH